LGLGKLLLYCPDENLADGAARDGRASQLLISPCLKPRDEEVTGESRYRSFEVKRHFSGKGIVLKLSRRWTLRKPKRRASEVSLHVAERSERVYFLIGAKPRVPTLGICVSGAR
jgi:hypothetical protein